jgi:hypothetical protein
MRPSALGCWMDGRIGVNACNRLPDYINRHGISVRFGVRSVDVRKLSAALLASALVFLLLVPFVGCDRENYFKLHGLNRDDLLYGTMPRADDAFALRSVDLLRQGRFDLVEDQLDPSIRNAQIRDRLTRIHDMFPSAQPASIKTVEAGSVRGRNGFTTHITLEYEYAPQIKPTSGRTELVPRSWLLAQVLILRSDGARTIRGLALTPTSKSFEEMNEFTFADKGISQYAGLSLALGVAGITLYAFVLCIRSKIGKKKWFWLLPILAGLLRVTVNWTSGRWTFTPLSYQIPPVNMSVEAYGPWQIIICAPVGAIAFLLYCRRLPKTIATLSLAQPPTLDQPADTQTRA